MERNADEKSLRQESQVVSIESKLVENTKTKGQKKTQGINKIMENETVGLFEKIIQSGYLTN